MNSFTGICEQGLNAASLKRWSESSELCCVGLLICNQLKLRGLRPHSYHLPFNSNTNFPPSSANIEQVVIEFDLGCTYPATTCGTWTKALTAAAADGDKGVRTSICFINTCDIIGGFETARTSTRNKRISGWAAARKALVNHFPMSIMYNIIIESLAPSTSPSWLST